jgi:hypothetical protein
MRNWIPRGGLLGLALALSSLLTAGPATAGVLTESVDCGPQTIERPFSRFLDNAGYTLAPGGDFEGSLAGWKLSRARVVSGNERFNVGGTGDSKSLSIDAGGSVTTAPVCVGLEHPTLRFFARSSGPALSLLKVEVLVETKLGLTVALPIGVATPTSQWQPTLPMPVLANLLPLLPGDHTAVAFRFRPVGSARWWIDDVYVDPKCR